MALQIDSWSAVYQAQLSRYQAVFDADHNMDTKGGVILGAILAVSVFVLNKQLFLVDNKLLFALLVVGCFAYVVALGLLVYALKPRQYTLPANTTKDHPEYLTKQDEDLLYQLVVDVELAADEIETNLRKKAVIFTVSTLLFVGGTLALLVVKLVAG
jgi:hypothetical protein